MYYFYIYYVINALITTFEYYSRRATLMRKIRSFEDQNVYPYALA